jgi:gamma-glutamyl hercynylcysteine S-oxide synthase
VSPAQAETLPPGGVDALPKDRCRELMVDARERSLALVEPVSEEDLDRIHHPLMSPLAWDLGHIAAFEDLWLCQRVGGMDALRPELAAVYDAAETPRAGRGGAPYLRAEEVRGYMASVRERALEVLERSDLSEEGTELTRGGLVWDMLVQHEHQHNETMLQTLALAPPGTYRPERRPPAPGPGEPPEDGMVELEGASFPLGAGAAGFVYDNERPQHEVRLDAYLIDRFPVSNGAYREFVEEGGYGRRELWSSRGWEWREAAGAKRPLYWTAEGMERSFDRVEAIRPELPVMHVCWYEAEAYARFAGKRLPTEAEWERAAAWEPASARKRRFPWGDAPADPTRANLDQTAFGPDPVAAHPEGASSEGMLGLIGDAWEWTASDFAPYPGFRAFPYRGYSEPFFGSTYKVLRGGSWASRPHGVRATLRNWDFPVRRQIHAGFRCAMDA